ncbi:GIY-YIG nuclease family protein [Phenylobacterium deserti]|uniref:GIY-YIG nuclease family protein n=1 Tax=Phenylobacterium deserti TaxID=1914756 RepID=A0A328A9R3_9CAUL|nr:GIY-YIG nuclease family protein [Phenylobacterium deserti]RAK51265.1 GIY-YIG nuclease family protein [Phenylobacterium deserti]
MDRQSRREAVRDYKERKIEPGVFAVRCAATGEAWVAASRNLAQQQNGIWFSLRLGSHMNRALQAAWNAHGAEAFRYEVLEAIEDEDLSDYSRNVLLKEREAHWLEAMGARRMF